MLTANGERSRILLIEPRASLRTEMAAALLTHLDGHLNCVEGGCDALELDLVSFHEAAIVSLDIEDMNGLELVRQLQQLRRRPIIVTTAEPAIETATGALRLGVCDYSSHPVDMEAVVECLETRLTDQRRAQRRHRRWERMRTLVQRMLKERRELQERMDVLCRDLVGAHQRLVRRVTETETQRGL